MTTADDGRRRRVSALRAREDEARVHAADDHDDDEQTTQTGAHLRRATLSVSATIT